MRKQPGLLILAVGLLSVGAIAQEIVIEPTNGRTAPARHTLTRPAAVEAAKPQAASPKTKSAEHSATQAANRPRTSSFRPARKAPPVTQLATKTPAEVIPTPPAAPVVAKNEAPEAAPAPPKLPARPAWAMVDTRDALTLQNEITNALARDPKLVGSNIRIDVNDAEVTLAGKANGTEERLQAVRLAQSYAWNRKLVDHIEVVPNISAAR